MKMKPDSDHEAVMDHVALEVMHAIENKDKAAFLEGFQVLVCDILDKMQPSDDEDQME